MPEQALAVVDTNVLLNLATPIVDGRSTSSSGADPLKAVLSTYDVHIPASVLGELTEATSDEDRLAAAASLVMQAADHLTTHDVDERAEDPLDYGLDRGESEAIWLASELSADLFITDEFNSTNYLFVALALEDRNILFTTPHLRCTLATHDVLPVAYVDAVLSYYMETKGWEQAYIDQLRQTYLES